MKIGVSKEVISPDKPELLKPTGMGRPYTTMGVLDDLYAEAMVIEDEGKIAALVTSDLRYFPVEWHERIADAVAARGIRTDITMLSSVHNHCSSPAPVDDSSEAQAACEEADQKIINGIAEAIRGAHENRRPAEIASSNVWLNETIGENRRIKFSNGSCINNWGGGAFALPGKKIYGPGGEHSRRINIFCVREPGSDTPFAIFTSYGSHPHMYELPYFSGEFPGAAKRAIGEQYPEAVILYANNMGGDMDIHLTHPMPDGKDEQIAWYKESLTFLGKRFADNIIPAIPEKGYVQPDKMQIDTWSKDIQTPKRLQPFEIQVLSLGDFAFVSFPGELFHLYNKRVFEASPYENLILMSYNGSGGVYLPDPHGFEEGSYEVKGGHVVSPDTGELLLEQMLRLLNKLAGSV